MFNLSINSDLYDIYEPWSIFYICILPYPLVISDTDIVNVLVLPALQRRLAVTIHQHMEMSQFKLSLVKNMSAFYFGT